MGRPILLDAWERPITSLVIALCSGVWYFLNSKGLGYEEVGVSYAKVVRDREYWRCLTASFSHISPLHLLFNMSSLWSLGVEEQEGLAAAAAWGGAAAGTCGTRW